MPDNSKRYVALLTGGTGYVGSRLLIHLTHSGWQVDVVVRPDSDLPPRMCEMNQQT